jgi:hypothetical protein
METTNSVYSVLQHLDGRLVSAIDILKPIGSTFVSDPLAAPSSQAAAALSPAAMHAIEVNIIISITCIKTMNSVKYCGRPVHIIY